MPRIRTVKPEFYKDEDLATLSEPAMILALGLLNQADDEGYFNANPLLLRAEIFPLREPSVSVQCMVTELSNIGYIQIFSGRDKKTYGHITNFLKHQKVNRPTPSKIRGLLIEKSDSVNTQGVLIEGSPPERKGKERKGKEGREGENFSPPTLKQIKSYCEENKIEINCEKFLSHYTSNGWTRGSNKITSWQATIDLWFENDKERKRDKKSTVVFDFSYYNNLLKKKRDNCFLSDDEEKYIKAYENNQKSLIA